MINKTGLIGTGLLLLALFALNSCSDSGVDEVFKPPTPRVAYISVSGPDTGGLLTVTGAAYAVKENVTVRALNADAAGQAAVEAAADGDGAFSLVIGGAYFDHIEISARNEAGSSAAVTVVAGAPFSLAAGVPSGDGQSAAVGTAPADSVAFKVADSDGLGVPGVEVAFAVSGGEATFSPATATSDDNGRVASRMTLGLTAGVLTVSGDSEDVDFAATTDLTITALPAPADTLVWVSGVGQTDGPGAELLRPLVIRAEDPYGNGVAGVEVVFTTGDGSVTPDRGLTGTEGTFQTVWTVGGTNGQQVLAAADNDGTISAADATAIVADHPTITSVSPDQPIMPGNPVTIGGTDFCAVAEYNHVTLGGVVMNVVASTETQIIATVPSGLTDGAHVLAVTVGHQAATPYDITVEVISSLGDVVDYPFVDGSVTVDFVIPNASTKYAVIPYSIKHTGAYPASAMSYGVQVPAFGMQAATASEPDPLKAFRRRVLTPPAEPASSTTRGADRLSGTFHCLANPMGSTADISNYSTVTATRVYAGENTEIWVDNTVLPASWAEESYIAAHLADYFDDTDYDIVVNAFGEPTDIDDTGTVQILLSPVVNAMAGYLGSSGLYVGGFFNIIDLDLFGFYEPSNSAEIFYAIVPDPTGQYSYIQHDVEGSMEALQSILVHEFQHMINAGQRHHPDYGGQPASNLEALWLNEGLSHLTEDLCGYHDQNVDRVKTYLHSRATAQTVVAMDTQSAQGNDYAERGGSFLLCRYLLDRWPGITNQLSGSSYKGMANVAHATGEDFDDIYKQWMAAIYLDDRDLDGDGAADDLGAAYRFATHNLRIEYPYPGGTAEPLAVHDLTFESPGLSSTLVVSSMDYITFRVAGGSPPAGYTKSLTFTGQSDGEMGVLVVRVAQ